MGLARLEFIINRMIGVHPRALLEFDRLDGELQGPDPRADGRLRGSGAASSSTSSREGIAQIAAAFAPEPVIVRLSDFKSNEYANLIGGRAVRAASKRIRCSASAAPRATSTKRFRPCFELECRALKRVREEMGLTNVQVMVPFVRTLEGSASRSPSCWPQNGLKRGENGLKIIMMCELPTNALLADEYLEYFDGMSIGSNDMTQLTLGLDRDSAIVAKLFDERDDGGEGAAADGDRRLPQAAASTSASAARALRITRTWRAGCSSRASRACRSIPDTVVETWLFLGERASSLRLALRRELLARTAFAR